MKRDNKQAPHKAHTGQAVRVGPYKVHAGGTSFLVPADIERFDIIIPLENKIPVVMGQAVTMLACPWPDMSPPPNGFQDFLQKYVVTLLQKEQYSVLVYCIGSHGRTGTFLASLISLLEPETLDPIAAVRERHCEKAVETLAQAMAVFALRGEALPEQYRDEF